MLKTIDRKTETVSREAAERFVSSVASKRTGGEWSERVICDVVKAIIDHRLSDAQTAAWLSTIACKGMTGREVVALVDAYVANRPPTPVVGADVVLADKHSTGGVGDKTTLIVAPIMAACGVPFAKLSGRGLGFAGGTIDKLEAIPGIELNLTSEQISQVVSDIGMAIVSQDADLAPGDAATYGLRDLVGAVESIPLIAASILSKKLALAPGALILDVKVGRGALTGDIDSAARLAKLMIAVAQSHGIATNALLTNMNVPLGAAIGNALEVREALLVLSGHQVSELRELSLRLAAELMQLSGCAADIDVGRERAVSALDSGAARETLLRWIDRQGGDASYVERLAAEPPTGPETVVLAPRDGFVVDIDPVVVGNATLDLGAGRRTEHDRIDPEAGIELAITIGQFVHANDPVARIYGSVDRHAKARQRMYDAIVIGDVQPAPAPVILDVIEKSDGSLDLGEVFV